LPEGKNRLFCSLNDLMEAVADFGGCYSVDTDILRNTGATLGPIHARQRLGIETDHEAQSSARVTFFHLENLSSAPAIIRNALKLTGLYGVLAGWHPHCCQAEHELRFAAAAVTFDGYTHSPHQRYACGA